jgi:hypothetical protein
MRVYSGTAPAVVQALINISGLRAARALLVTALLRSIGTTGRRPS